MAGQFPGFPEVQEDPHGRLRLRVKLHPIVGKTEILIDLGNDRKLALKGYAAARVEAERLIAQAKTGTMDPSEGARARAIAASLETAAASPHSSIQIEGLPAGIIAEVVGPLPSSKDMMRTHALIIADDGAPLGERGKAIIARELADHSSRHAMRVVHQGSSEGLRGPRCCAGIGNPWGMDARTQTVLRENPEKSSEKFGNF